jgi:hypothetical protein
VHTALLVVILVVILVFITVYYIKKKKVNIVPREHTQTSFNNPIYGDVPDFRESDSPIYQDEPDYMTLAANE